VCLGCAKGLIYAAIQVCDRRTNRCSSE